MNFKKEPEIPTKEKERLKELNIYNNIEAAEEDDLDFLAKKAAQICTTKIPLVILGTNENHCILYQHGLEIKEILRDISFCAHAINTPEKSFFVENIHSDIGFFDNPLTIGNPHASL